MITEPMRSIRLPATVMMWTINDPVIEDSSVLENEFHDIRHAGFAGVAALVRCSRYRWVDAAAMDALARISGLCRRYGMAFWVSADARAISAAFCEKGEGLTVLAYGDHIRARQVPHVAPIVNGRFSIRCAIPARPAHTVSQVAIEYQPAGLFKVFAVRADTLAHNPAQVLDITQQSHFFYNAREKYVEAFGRVDLPDRNSWQVVAFFRLIAAHVDFSNPAHINSYLRTLQKFAEQIEQADGLVWDEPGFTCMYGCLPFSPAIARRFRLRSGRALDEVIWQMALASADNSHIPVRTCYFTVLQEFMLQVQKRSRSCVQAVWGDSVLSGIHDTWHFESAHMCDMNHGSLDLWKSLTVKSGGFVDIGGVQELRLPESPWYANLAAMATIGRSLARFSSDRFGFNNLWTMGQDDGSGLQSGVLGHCVKIMRLFDQRWLAHIYGPAGTIGEEHSFLGSIPLPGYPHHVTWPEFGKWCAQLSKHFEAVPEQPAWANLLLIFPVETMYSLANEQADVLAKEIFRLLLYLVDHHCHIDVLSSTFAGKGKWRQDRFCVGASQYEMVLLPFADVIASEVWASMQQRPDRCCFMYSKPVCTAAGQAIPVAQSYIAQVEDLYALLDGRSGLRPVQAPDHTWVALTPGAEGDWISLAPARYGMKFSGQVQYGNKSFMVPTADEFIRIFFPHHGDPRLAEGGASV